MFSPSLIRNSEKYHNYWFERGQADNIRFWSRLGHKPDLKGLTILDVGCGHGRLCLEMAIAGASKVVGIDIDKPVLDFARRNLKLRYPEWQKVVSFEFSEINALPGNTFDLIVSKDAFEHVIDLRGLLAGIRRCLKPGGRLYAGFGALYYSPTGHHDRMHFGLPWGHLLIPKSWHLALRNMRRKKPIKSLYEIDYLNEMSFADYENIFRECGLKMISFRVNQSEHVMSNILHLLRKIPILREYCTYNIYCVMENRD
jgi:SAM-dependent methyltransferase